jgi:PKD repeat protein
MKPVPRLLVATCAAILAAGGASAQVCNLGTTTFFDTSVTCPGPGRELCNTGRIYLWNTWSYGGKQFLIGSTYSNAIFYDVSDPTSPTQVLNPGPYQPWGQAEADNVPDDDRQQWDVALLDNYQYGLTMFQNYGWATFRVNVSPTTGNPTGFTNISRFRDPILPSSSPASFARLFRGGDDQVYAVGAWLNQSTSAVVIAPFTSGVIDSASARAVSGVSAGDRLETLVRNNKFYLLAFHNYAVKIFDLSTVTAAALANPLWSLSSINGVGSGAFDFYVDKDSARLALLNSGNAFTNPPTAGAVSVYDLSDPANPSLVATMTLDAKAFNAVACTRTVVVAAQSSPYPSAPWVQVFSIANPASPFEIARGQLDPPTKTGESIQDLWVGTGGTGDIGIYEAAFSVGSMTRLSATCLSLDPVASFTVTGGVAAETCPATPTGASQGIADEGFPGDTFTIADHSYGEITGKTVTITQVAGAQVFTSTWNALSGQWSNGLSWTPATSATPGEYYVEMDLTPQAGTNYTRTMSIWLCDSPSAALAFTQGGAQNLVGDSVNVSAAATAGHPNATTPYSFYVIPPGGAAQALTAGGSTLASPYTLATKGSYTLGVVAHYDFLGTATTCGGVDPQFLNSVAGNFDSCASLTASAANGVSLFEVWQNGVKVADSTSPGAVLVDQATTLKFTGTVASAYTPNFVWNIQNVASHLTCSFTASPYTGSTCAIGANTWTVGNAFWMNMGLQVCSGVPAGTENCSGGTTEDTIAAPQVNVTPSQYSFAFHLTTTSPTIGQSVGAVVDEVTGTFSSMTVVYGGTACDGSTQKTVTCGDVLGVPGTNPCVVGKTLATFTYNSSGAKTVTASGLVAGSTVPGTNNSGQVTVGASGSCGPQPLTVSANPSSTTVGSTVTFSISPTLTQNGDSATFTFGDGQNGSLTYPCPPLVGCTVSHSYSTANTYTVNASATIGGASYAGSTTVTITSGGGGGTLTISPSKNPANPGDSVVFSFSPTLSRAGDALTVNFGDGQQGTVSYPCPLGSCTAVHVYNTANTFTVSASGTAGGAGVSGSLQLQVLNNCQYPSAPTANFTVSPNPANATHPVQFTDTSTGNPTSWSWKFGDAAGIFGGGSSTQQNPVYTYAVEGTYTVTLTASNCRGSTQKQIQVVVGPSCTETEVPTPDFTWSPTGTLASYPQQMQPYAGQQVTLTDASTNSANSWHWDFGDGTTANVTTPSTTHAWAQPGTYTVTATVSNCVGPAQPVSKTITVASDIRPVTADFTWSPSSNLATGTPAIFTAAQGPAYGDPDTFTWTFDDGSTQYGPQVTYTFTCGGSRRVTLAAERSNYHDPNGPGRVTKTIQVTGDTCAPESVMAVDAAKVKGLNGTDWHADLRIYNPSASPTSVTLQFLPAGQDNSDPFTLGPYKPAVPPHATLVLNDILQWLQDQSGGQAFSKTALRVTYQNDDDVPPVVLMNTYNLLPDGSRYGQINSGVNVIPGSTQTPLWLTGLHNNGVTDGFRTNYSIVNLQGDPGGVNGITFTLYDTTGAFLGSKTFNLAPYGYIQDSIRNLFGAGFDDIGDFSMKIDVPAGREIQTYASVMDNHTGDPVMIPAITPPDSPIYLPAIGHLNGVGGTVWRADLQLTNPDGAAHTWRVTYTPKAGDGVNGTFADVTVPGNASVVGNDVVGLLYGNLISSDTQTSGIIRIAPAPSDGSSVYPIVEARAYNVAPNGTYGQGIPPLWAAKGVSAGDGRKLVLAGMSTEDIARTNVGFVDLSESDNVNFAVYFYNEDGTLLNPTNGDGSPQPLTISIGPGTWDQDKLENRFRNAFKTSLPANLRAVSAEITVTSGGPGYAYATVIDSMTGDPNFVAAQPVP